MMVRVRCQHCGRESYVEDMGDNCVCQHCRKYIISISEYVRQQIKGEKNG